MPNRYFVGPDMTDLIGKHGHQLCTKPQCVYSLAYGSKEINKWYLLVLLRPTRDGMSNKYRRPFCSTVRFAGNKREKGWRIMRCTAGDYRQVTSFCLKHVIGAIMLLLFYYSILFGNSWRSELSLIITLFCLIFKRLPQKGYIQIEKGKRYQHQPTIDPAHTSAHAYYIYPVSTLRCMI